jgi:hypothetical protein
MQSFRSFINEARDAEPDIYFSHGARKDVIYTAGASDGHTGRIRDSAAKYFSKINGIDASKVKVGPYLRRGMTEILVQDVDWDELLKYHKAILAFGKENGLNGVEAITSGEAGSYR